MAQALGSADIVKNGGVGAGPVPRWERVLSVSSDWDRDPPGTPGRKSEREPRAFQFLQPAATNTCLPQVPAQSTSRFQCLSQLTPSLYMGVRCKSPGFGGTQGII